ncbi:metal ABC transporter permease [Candidatus Woesearchaeota archaeon]|nr:metal ABC transporter permease [Candidatus Woesearchaeota archaeon]
MNISMVIPVFELFTYGFMQKALVGGTLIALCCGLLGPFLVLRRLSLLGDGLAHLSFGGIALGLLLGVNPLISALITVILGSFWVRSLVKKNVYGDAAIALLLSLGVGVGVTVIGVVRGFNVSLYSYLIGSVLTLSPLDLILSSLVLLAIIFFLTYFYRELFLNTFNEELARFSAKRVAISDLLFTLLTAMMVVIAIRAVGILLVSALIVIPTLISLNLAKSFKQTLFFSSLSAFVAVMVGILVSYGVDTPPSGSIVLLLFAGFMVTELIKRRK